MTFAPFTERARAKINLALHVLGRRPDGYHDLDSIVTFAETGDELRFSPAREFAISAEGPFAALLPPVSENIITKARDIAAAVARSRGKTLPSAAIHLTKNLPVASGIGGGSANGAAALRGLLKISGIGIDDEIMAAALALGADVPVCLKGRPCRMQGIGERIMPVDDLPPMRMVLVNPNIAVATAEVFRKLDLAPGQSFGSAIGDVNDMTAWRNDLTGAAIALAPEIAEVQALLRELPNLRHTGMSGSGATCFALVDGDVPKEFERSVAARRWWMSAPGHSQMR